MGIRGVGRPARRNGRRLGTPLEPRGSTSRNARPPVAPASAGPMEVERRWGVHAGRRDPRRDFAPGRLTLVEDASGIRGAAPGLCPVETAPGHRRRRAPGRRRVPARRRPPPPPDGPRRRPAPPGGAPSPGAAPSGNGARSPRVPRSGKVVRHPRGRRTIPRPSRNRGRSAGAIRHPHVPPSRSPKAPRPRRPGPAPGGPRIPNFRADPVNAAIARSTCSGRRADDDCFRRRALPGGAPRSGTRSPRIPRSGRSSAIPDADPAFPGLPGTGARSAGEIRRRPGPAPGGPQIPNFRADSVNAATARSTCSGPCAADNCTRMRAFPSGTTG